MNDRHPAGDSFPADSGADYAYAGYDTAYYEQSAYGSYGTTGHGTSTGDAGWPADAHDASGTAAYPAGSEAGGYDTGSYGSGGYDGSAYETGAYDTTGYGTAAYDGHTYGADAYGNAGWEGHGAAEHQNSGLIPQQPGPHAAEQDWSALANGTAQWDMSALQASGWDGTAYDQGQNQDGHGYDTGGLPADAYATGTYAADALTADPQATGSFTTDPLTGGTFTADGYPADAYDTGAYDTGSYDHATYGTGVYGAEASAPDGFATASYEGHGWTAGYDTPVAGADGPAFEEQPTAAYASYEAHEAYPGHASAEAEAFTAEAFTPEAFTAEELPADPFPADPFLADPHTVETVEADALDEPMVPPGPEAEPEPGAATPVSPGRGRRRSPKPRRSALLTVAAPSVAVLGVAGIAAATVIPSGDEETAQAAPDTTEVKASPANTKLDTQLAGLREAGDDFADRASRTQERIDLKKREEAERKRRAEEAARREALRPKFALPVKGAGISAYFGQAGINWMSVHTGLDFPVSYGTPVLAATDGTVRTQWNSAYGNMIIVTAADGTETWYCHLSSTRIRSGTVKAGTTIGYSGNSGNSTGPHLHFEVRPGGGSAIDPLSWFRSHGLEPS